MREEDILTDIVLLKDKICKEYPQNLEKSQAFLINFSI